MKRFFGIVAVTAALTACGGGAMLKPSNSIVSAESEFCGVNVKFSDNPRNATQEENKEFAQLFGNFEKINATALVLDNYQLTEGVICLCRDVVIDKFIINASGKENVIQKTIPDVGIATYFEKIDPTVIYRYQYIVPTNESSCQIFQLAKSPINSNYKPIFFDSITAIKTKSNSFAKTTTKDRLIQLDALRNDGLINQSEYEIKKKSILDSF